MADILSEVIVLSLIVWYISNMIRYEDGPLGVFSKLQDFVFTKFTKGVVPSGVLGALGYLGFQALTCFSCTVTVISGGLSALTQDGWTRFVIIWLAVSGLARFMDYLVMPPQEEVIDVPPIDTFDSSTTLTLP